MCGLLSPRHGAYSGCMNGSCEYIKTQSQTADKEWSSSFGFVKGLTSPHLKNNSLLRNITHGLIPGRILWNDQVDRDQWRALVKTVMNTRVTQKAGIFFSESLLASEPG
jgi:hypothetical protein